MVLRRNFTLRTTNFTKLGCRFTADLMIAALQISRVKPDFWGLNRIASKSQKHLGALPCETLAAR